MFFFRGPAPLVVQICQNGRGMWRLRGEFEDWSTRVHRTPPSTTRTTSRRCHSTHTFVFGTALPDLRLLHESVWPDLAKNRHVGQSVKILLEFFSCVIWYLAKFCTQFGKMWQIFVVVNAQIWKNNLTIWSQCAWWLLTPTCCLCCCLYFLFICDQSCIHSSIVI